MCRRSRPTAAQRASRQTWEIVADGGLAGSPKATVEVLALIETPKVPASSYAAFATDTMCGALSVSGSVDVKSYDSTLLTGATARDAHERSDDGAGGDVGTNGNLTISGNADVGGKLFTPRTGIGACTNGANGAIDGLTEGGSATVTGGMVKLPAALVYPAPQMPGPSLLPATSRPQRRHMRRLGPDGGQLHPAPEARSRSTATV